MGSLTRSEAIARAEAVAVSSYHLELDLTSGPDSFRSVTTVRFTAQPGVDTFVEVRPQRLREARLNGLQVPSEAFVDGRLWLKGVAAENELVVDADFAYSNASEGLHRFVDPADGEVYVYAQPAITQAPRFMACFDQPDLKAPVHLRVRVDPRWTVRANSPGTPVEPGRWEFSPTPPIATYLVTMAAGPFVARHAEHDGVPLGLYVRASLAEALDREADELFEVTTAALDHYHRLFGIRYPFGKYDQVFAPEFSWGADRKSVV